MILTELLDFLDSAAQTIPVPIPTVSPSPIESIPPSSPSSIYPTQAPLKPSESGEITPTGLLTVGVAVTAGVLSALGTAWVQNVRAKHERQSTRLNALWNYHRALTDISASVDKFYGEDLELYGEGSAESRLATARNEAYLHFHVFPKEDQARLRFPTIVDYQHPHELRVHVDKANNVLETYLNKYSKE